MRIISGLARGTRLETLEGKDTRPTLDRVKEALFSIIQNEIYDATILDLFSGSGALAIESISRGAKMAYSCDVSKKAVEIIICNVEKTHFEDKVRIINKDFKKCLEELRDLKFDIIFLDPPYKSNYAVEAIKIIIENEMLNKDGIIVFETDKKEQEYIQQLKEYVNINKIKKYGRVSLLFLSSGKE